MSVSAESGEVREVDWYRVYKILLHAEGQKFSFERIERMTIPELALALDRDFDEKKKGPGGDGVMSAEELEEHARWWRSLTPWDRLERAALERGDG